MEITTISLLAVTDQYLHYLRQWQDEDMPLANMAAFISIASRLLYIKSQSLLPHASKEDMAGEMESAADMAEELRAHLLEYKLAKDIARYLRQREEAGLQTHARSGLLAGIEAQLAWSPPTLIGLEADTLAQAFRRILELRARDEATSAAFLPLARVRVSERIAEIVGILRARPQLSLAELLDNDTIPPASSSSPSWPCSNYGSMNASPLRKAAFSAPFYWNAANAGKIIITYLSRMSIEQCLVFQGGGKPRLTQVGF